MADALPDDTATEAPFRTAAEWAAHLRWRAVVKHRPTLVDHAREWLGAPIDRVEDVVFGAEGATVLDRAVAETFRQLNGLARRGRTSASVVERYREYHTHVNTLADVRALPLEAIDAARPTWLTGYDFAAVVSGGLGGLFGVFGAVAGVPALFFASLHAIGTFAQHFGHDLEDRAEQEFAISILAASLVTRPSTRVQVIEQLEVMAARLEEGQHDAADVARTEILSNVAEAVALRLGLGLLVRSWPGVGLLLGAGFSRAFVSQVCETALAAYEQRWLLRHYGAAARITG